MRSHAAALSLLALCAGVHGDGAGFLSAAAAHPLPHHLRRLQSITPVELNKLLSRVKIDVCAVPGACFPAPATTRVTHLPLGDLDVSYWNVVCDGVSVGEMELTASQESDSKVRLGVSLQQITISCGNMAGAQWPHIAWEADYALHPTGTATFVATAAHQNGLYLVVDVLSDGTSFAMSLPKLDSADSPHMRTPTECAACGATHGRRTDVRAGFIGDLTVSGRSADGWLIEKFQDTIRDKILDAINPVLSEQIGSIIPDLLTDVLEELNDGLTPFVHYLGQQHAEEDAMSAEIQLRDDIAHGAVSRDALVNLNEDKIIDLAKMGLDALGLNSLKLEVNTLLPQILPKILPHAVMLPNGTLVATGFLGLFGSNSTIVIGGSGAIEMDIFIREIRIGGLNTFTRCDLLQLTGDYTVANFIDLERLGLEVDLTLTMKPDGASGGVVVVDNTPIIESITLRSSVDHLAVELASLIAMEEALYEVSLGDMLLDPIGCTSSKVFRSNVTEANATIRGIAFPTITGFISHDMDDVFDKITEVSWMMYEQVGEQLLPWIMQTEIRRLLNEATADFLAEEQHSNCATHPRKPPGSFLDFRSVMFQQVNLTQKLSWLLNEVIGPDNANEAIGDVTSPPGEYTYSEAVTNDSTILEDFAVKNARDRSNWLAANPGKTEDEMPGWMTGPGVCMRCAKVGAMHLEVSNLRVSGLDSVEDFDLVHPTGASELHNHVDATNIQLAVDVAFSVKGETLRIDDVFTLRLNMSHVTVLADILLQIDENRFFDLQLQELVEWKRLASTLTAARAVEAGVTFGEASVAIDCERCSSPLLRQLAVNLAQASTTDVTADLNGFFDNFIDHFTHDPNVIRQFNLEVAKYADEVRDGLNRQMHQEAASGTCSDFDGPICGVWQSINGMACETNTAYQHDHCRKSCGLCGQVPEDVEDLSVLGFFAGLLLVLATCGAIGWCFWSERDEKQQSDDDGELGGNIKRGGTRSRSVSREARLLSPVAAGSQLSRSQRRRLAAELSDAVDERDDSVSDATNLLSPPSLGAAEDNASLLRDSEHLPLWQRVGVPLALVANVAIFMYGHLHIGAELDIDAHLMGDHLYLDRFIEFSLGHSLVDMWNGKAYSLFFMVGIFSGVWPYTKLLVMMYCWCATPGKRFTKASRSKILSVLDYAGTWSLIDLYVLSMFILAFRLHVVSPSVSYVPDEIYLFDTLVTPVSGLYAFIFGVALSIALNFWVLTLSRSTRQSDGDITRYTSCRAMPGTPQKLSLREVLKHVRQRERLYRCCSMVDCVLSETRLVFLLLLGSIVLTVIGALAPSFEFRVYGLAGVAIEVGTAGGSVSQFSLISSVLAMGAQAGLDNYAGPLGVWFIAAVYGSFCFLVPLTVLVTGGVQLLLPMTLRQQRRVALISEGLRAWSALEVFVVSVGVTMLQLAPVSGMILNGACKIVAGTVRPALQYGMLDVSLFDPKMGTNECFIIEAGTLPAGVLPQPSGIWLLIAAAVLSSFTNRWISSLTERAIKHRFENPEFFELGVHDEEGEDEEGEALRSRASSIRLTSLSPEPEPEPAVGAIAETAREAARKQAMHANLAAERANAVRLEEEHNALEQHVERQSPGSSSVSARGAV